MYTANLSENLKKSDQQSKRVTISFYDGQYVPSHVRIIELPIMSADDGEYMPSTVKIIELPK
jgi:hypothetical protein